MVYCMSGRQQIALRRSPWALALYPGSLPTKRSAPMTTAIAPKKLYLFQLSTTTILLPAGQTLEMSSPCYLIETTDNKRLLIDSGMAPDAPHSPVPSTNEKNVL